MVQDKTAWLFELKLSQMVGVWWLAERSGTHVPGESQMPAGALVQAQSLGSFWKNSP